jgi:hypothetical protein
MLMASIIAPCLLGIWLDNRFKTSFWTPVLFLLGATWGFYDLFRTVTVLSKRKQIEMQQRRQAGAARPSGSGASRVGSSPSAAPSETTPETIEPERPRPRLFDVPPPPLSSFDEGVQAPSSTRKPVVDAADDELPDDNAELMRRLLNELDDDSDEENDLQSKDAPPKDE